MGKAFQITGSSEGTNIMARYIMKTLVALTTLRWTVVESASAVIQNYIMFELMVKASVGTRRKADVISCAYAGLIKVRLVVEEVPSTFTDSAQSADSLSFSVEQSAEGVNWHNFCSGSFFSNSEEDIQNQGDPRLINFRSHALALAMSEIYDTPDTWFNQEASCIMIGLASDATGAQYLESGPLFTSHMLLS